MNKVNKEKIIIGALLITALATGCMSDEAVDTKSEGTNVNSVETVVANTESEMFTDRDLEQTADLSGATYIEVESNEDITIEDEGVYVISGSAEEVTIVVDAEDDAKVQIVLDNLSVTNENKPIIYVVAADKVFVTTNADSVNNLEVTSTFTSIDDVNLDAVIFSKSDLVINGLGTLNITSSDNGITSKDDLKVTGSTLNIDTVGHSLEGNDSIRIYDGEINITTLNDALHAENDDDSSLGYIYIEGGSLNIEASDDAIRGTSYVRVDGGEINISTSSEGIEATTVLINGGVIDIYATDDGINATKKSDEDVIIKVTGGSITVEMASGDTDAFDSNGDLEITGGYINVTGGSTFDFDGSVTFTGGTVVENGTEITEITASQQGGGMPGGMVRR